MKSSVGFYAIRYLVERVHIMCTIQVLYYVFTFSRLFAFGSSTCRIL